MEFLNKAQIDECVEILKEDKALIFPTETVFGIGIKATSESNYERLVEIKKRPPDKPFTLMCSDISQFENLVEINDVTRKIIEHFMPGAITLIIKTKKEVPHFIDLGTGFVGVRIPDDEFVLKMISKVGAPLLVPSANKSGETPALNSKVAYEYFKDDDVSIVEGECINGLASTIIKIDGEEISLIRKGPISLEKIKEIV